MKQNAKKKCAIADEKEGMGERERGSIDKGSRERIEIERKETKGN